MGLLEDLRAFYGEPPSRAARRPAIDPSMPLLAQLNSFYGGPPGMRSILEDEEEEDPQEKLRRLAEERSRRMKEEGDRQAEELGLHGPVAVPGSEEDPGHMGMMGAGAKEGLRAVGLGTAQLAVTGGEVASHAMRGDLAGAIGSLIHENVAERWMRQKSEAMRRDFEETREAYLVADPKLTDPDRPAHKLSPRQALAFASEVVPQAVEALIPYGAAVRGARGAVKAVRSVDDLFVGATRAFGEGAGEAVAASVDELAEAILRAREEAAELAPHLPRAVTDALDAHKTQARGLLRQAANARKAGDERGAQAAMSRVSAIRTRMRELIGRATGDQPGAGGPGAVAAAPAGKLTREAAAESARKSVRPTAGNDPEVLGDAIQVLKREMATGRISEEEATERLLRLGRLEAQVTDPHLGDLQRASLAIGEDASTAGAAQSPRSTKALPYDLDDEGRRLVDVPEGSFTEPETPFQFNPHKLDLSLEMKAMLPEVVERNLAEFQKRGSGVVKPWSRLENVEELAMKLGTTVDDLKGRTGAMTDEELAIINAATSGAGQKVHRLTRAALDNPDDLALRVERDAAMMEFKSLAAVSFGASSEAARTLNAQKNLYLAMGAETAERIKLYKRYKSNITPEGEFLLASIDPTNVDDLMSFLSVVDEPEFGRLLHTYWISSILTGVGTQGRNIFGNAGMVLNELMVQPTTAAVESLKPLVGRPRAVFFKESIAGMGGLLSGAPRGAAKGMRALRYGHYDEGSKFMNFTRNPWLMKAKAMEFRGASGAKAVKGAGLAIDVPFRGLSGLDVFFRSIGETMAANRLATRKAIEEGARGQMIGVRAGEIIQARPEWLMKEVEKLGRKMVFTDEVSDVVKGVLEWRDKPVLGVISEVFMPFARVADRILAREAEMSPLGLVKVVRKGREQGWTPEVSELTARVGIGSGIMMAATAHGMNGNITAWAPRDPAERDQFYGVEKKKPWSIKIGNRWVPFGQMSPFSFPLALAAIAVEAAKTDQPLSGDRLLTGIVGVAAYVKDKAFMEGMEQVTNLMSGDYRSVQGLKSVYRSLGGLVWPSGFLRNVSTLWDDGQIRQPEEVWDYILGNIPGSRFRGSLPVRLDTRGRPVRKDAPLRSLFGGTPIAFTEEDYGDLIDREFRRHGLTRTYAGRTLGGKRLSDEEWRRYHKRSAEIIDMRLRQIFDSPAYWGRPDEQKKLINRAVRRGRRDARDELGLR